MIYLACPYSHDERNVRVERFNAVNIVAARLMGEGKHVFSPITHCHPLSEAGGLPTDWGFWEAYDRTMIDICEKVIVLTLDGWVKSKGVTAEIAIARELGIPVEYIKA